MSSSMSATARKPIKPVAAARPGSGRPAADSRLVRGSSNPRADPVVASSFNSKEAGEFLAARVAAAMEASRKTAPGEEGDVFVYQGEQRAWGATRPFNPVKDDFLQLVEMAIDSFKQSHTDAASQEES